MDPSVHSALHRPPAGALPEPPKDVLRKQRHSQRLPLQWAPRGDKAAHLGRLQGGTRARPVVRDVPPVVRVRGRGVAWGVPAVGGDRLHAAVPLPLHEVHQEGDHPCQYSFSSIVVQYPLLVQNTVGQKKIVAHTRTCPACFSVGSAKRAQSCHPAPRRW